VFRREQRVGGLLRRLVLALAIAAAVAVAGCGDDRLSPDEIARPVDPPPLPTQTPTPAKTVTAKAERRSTSRDTSILTARDRSSFERLAATLGGDEGLAVSGVGLDAPVEVVGPLQTGVAWSTSKVPVAMAVIARGGRRSQADDLTRALTASDNEAALRLWATLGDDTAAASAAEDQLRQAGDSRTQVEARRLRGAAYTPFGQTNWSLRDQARFTAGMACLDAGAEVLSLMNEVIPAQRWGLGAAGVDAQFKGGWGPGSEPGVGGGDFDRQMGVMTIDGKPLVVTMAVRPADGSHDTGTRNLTTIARWLVAHANVHELPARARC
jgi:hypothetical protein